ncbi:hypothetical protein BO70DRAFT_359449, partial [Aspergillus heteromorphus CBS 117.55]
MHGKISLFPQLNRTDGSESESVCLVFPSLPFFLLFTVYPSPPSHPIPFLPFFLPPLTPHSKRTPRIHQNRNGIPPSIPIRNESKLPQSSPRSQYYHTLSVYVPTTHLSSPEKTPIPPGSHCQSIRNGKTEIGDRRSKMRMGVEGRAENAGNSSLPPSPDLVST